MMSDEYLVECQIDDDYDDYDEEVMKIHATPTPPPQFCSSTQVSISHGENRDPYEVNNHLKVSLLDLLLKVFTGGLQVLLRIQAYVFGGGDYDVQMYFWTEELKGLWEL